MKVIKKINNNVALAEDESGIQCFIVGKGLGFGQIPYEIEKDDNRIENVFIPKKYSDMLALFENFPAEIVDCTKKIVDEGEKILNTTISQNILYPLCDHIAYSIERIKENLKMDNPLQYEIRHMYPKEMEVGLKAIEIIKQKFNVELDKGEAAFIALHFVNAEFGNQDIGDVSRLTDIIKEILSIVQYTLHVNFDEDSINFSRFVTHIRYFVVRQSNNVISSNENQKMYDLMVEQTPSIALCVDKIAKFIKDEYDLDCCVDEKLYLMLHLQRLKSRIE